MSRCTVSIYMADGRMCLDLHCTKCGHDNHIVQAFKFGVECAKCFTLWARPSTFVQTDPLQDTHWLEIPAARSVSLAAGVFASGGAF